MMMVLRIASSLPRDGMCVIEANQPLAVRSMQGKRIVKTVRLRGRYRYLRYHKSDPITASWIHHEHLPVEIQESVERRVTGQFHGSMLSE